MASLSNRLILCGISHKTSTLEERAPLGFGHADLAQANAEFSDIPEVIESCIISTCNRVEFYLLTDKHTDPFELVSLFYKKHKNIDLSPLNNNFQIKRDKHVVSHLLKVVGGLESMVLGESQVHGQVKEAYSSACAVKATGKVIHRLFHQAFRVGKQIRSDTVMGKGACSVSSASIDLIKSKNGNLKDPTVLFIGINQMISLAASNLSRKHHGEFLFANRTKEKAIQLAKKYGAKGFGLDELPRLLQKADILISCTGSEQPIVSASMIEVLKKEIPDKKLVMMDMAIPRDIEYQKETFTNIYLFDLEDVRHHAACQQQKREAAIPQAEEIVERRLEEFMYWFDNVRHERLSASVEESFEQLREKELAEVINKLSPDLQNELNEATRSLVQKLVRVTARTCSKCSTSEKE